MTSPVLLWRNGKEELLSRTKTPWEEGNIEPRQSSRKSEAIQIFWKLDKDEISLTWSRMILQIENFLGNKSPHRTLGGWDWSSRGQSTSLTGWMDETEGVSVPLLTGCKTQVPLSQPHCPPGVTQQVVLTSICTFAQSASRIFHSLKSSYMSLKDPLWLKVTKVRRQETVQWTEFIIWYN